LNKALSATDDIVHVRGTKVTRKVAPGVQVQIGSEIMTVVHAMQHNEISNTGTTARLLVNRAQQGTQADAHQKCPLLSVGCNDAQVFFRLPGFQAGDDIPFKVSRKAGKERILAEMKSKYSISDEDLERLSKM
jgi:hypothetical protein